MPQKILVHDYAGHAFPVDLSRELARRGHEVCHAYAGNLNTPRGDLQIRHGDPCGFSFKEIAMDYRYPKWKYSFLRRRGLEVSYGHACASWIQQFKPDIVISGNTPTDSQISIQHATQQTGAKFVSWIQDFYGIAIDKLLRKKIGLISSPIGFYYRWLDGKILRSSDHIIVITEDFIPLVQAEGVPVEKITSIPNWAIINEIAVRPKNNDWALQHKLNDKFVFLYTGTLGMKHNPALLSNLARLYRNKTDVRIVVVSEGQGAKWLNAVKQAEGLTNLLVLPYQPFTDLPDLLASGDVLIAILESEAGVFSVPSKVLSYLCAKRPILLSVPKENLSSRMVQVANAGLAVEPGDLKGFNSAASALYHDSSLRDENGRNGRRFAETNFDISTITEKFLIALGIT